MKAIIFTNGQYENWTFYKNYMKDNGESFVICADGGANAAFRIGVVPDVVIGDMDSIEAEVLNQYKAVGVEVKIYSTHKDETDTELALHYALKRGADEIIFFGALGSRLDHSFGNIYLLNHLLKAGIKGEIVNETNRVFLVDDSAKLNVEIGDTVSILSYSDYSEGINLEGFEYPVQNGVMEHYIPGYGISNVALTKTPKISVERGILMVDIVREKIKTYK